MATLEASTEEEDESKYQERASAVFDALCSYLVQEVSLGRTVHVPNLGLFFHAGPGTGEMRFKVLEKMLPPEHSWEGPSPGIGPISKARAERIASSAGVHKDLAEEMMQTVVKEFWGAVKDSPEVELDLPGIGKIKVRNKTVSFEPFADARLSRSMSPVTAEHAVFSKTASQLMERMSQSRSQWRPKNPTLEPLLRKTSSTPALPTPGAPGPSPQARPSPPERTANVPFPKQAAPRREARLASLKADAETLAQRFTRQLPASEQLFPPLLDRCSRTRSALFREVVQRDNISNVIASNYSAQSQTMTIDHEAKASISGTLIRRRGPPPKQAPGAPDQRNMDWTAEWPKILEDSPVKAEIQSVNMGKNEFCRILSRYR
ncbi:unnamed protein product, partial [Effrenium voratum]